MTIQQCCACKIFIQGDAYYSLTLDCEKFDDNDNLVILTSNNLLTLCSDCIDKISIAKILSYPARVLNNTAHDGFDELKRLLDNE